MTEGKKNFFLDNIENRLVMRDTRNFVMGAIWVTSDELASVYNRIIMGYDSDTCLYRILLPFLKESFAIYYCIDLDKKFVERSKQDEFSKSFSVVDTYCSLEDYTFAKRNEGKRKIKTLPQRKSAHGATVLANKFRDDDIVEVTKRADAVIRSR